jgi:BRCT domain type II-containing protein
VLSSAPSMITCMATQSSRSSRENKLTETDRINALLSNVQLRAVHTCEGHDCRVVQSQGGQLREHITNHAVHI